MQRVGTSWPCSPGVWSSGSSSIFTWIMQLLIHAEVIPPATEVAPELTAVELLFRSGGVASGLKKVQVECEDCTEPDITLS